MKNFDEPYSSAKKPLCLCPNCIKEVGETEIWQQALLKNMAINLRDRDINFGTIPDDLGDLCHFLFNLGYSTGRLFSEYTLKEKMAISSQPELPKHALVEVGIFS